MNANVASSRALRFAHSFAHQLKTMTGESFHDSSGNTRSRTRTCRGPVMTPRVLSSASVSAMTVSCAAIPLGPAQHCVQERGSILAEPPAAKHCPAAALRSGTSLLKVVPGRQTSTPKLECAHDDDAHRHTVLGGREDT